MNEVDDQERRDEAAVTASFSMPMSLATWLNNEMEKRKSKRSPLIVEALQLLRAQSETDQQKVAA